MSECLYCTRVCVALYAQKLVAPDAVVVHMVVQVLLRLAVMLRRFADQGTPIRQSSTLSLWCPSCVSSPCALLAGARERDLAAVFGPLLLRCDKAAYSAS